MYVKTRLKTPAWISLLMKLECVNCRVIGKDIKDLKALLITLQNDIKELEANNTKWAASNCKKFTSKRC